MITLKFTIKKRWWLFSYQRTVRRKLPESWSEVSLKQAIQYASLLLKFRMTFTDTLDTHHKFLILNSWSGISKEAFYSMSEEEIGALMHRLQPIFEATPIPPVLRMRIFGIPFRLPKMKLAGENVEAWDFYELYYRNIVEGEGDEVEENLGMLCGYLLRPFTFFLWPLNTLIAKKIASYLQQKKPHLMHYIYWWYFCTRQQLRSQYPGAFTGSGKKGADFTSHFGWRGYMYSIAEEGPWEDIEDVKKADLHEFMTFIDYNHGRMKEREFNKKTG